jgi:hypothetical protein
LLLLDATALLWLLDVGLLLLLNLFSIFRLFWGTYAVYSLCTLTVCARRNVIEEKPVSHGSQR